MLLAAIGLALALALLGSDHADRGRFEESLAAVLQVDVIVEQESVRALEAPSPLRYGDVLFLGRVDPEAPADLYFVEARAGDDGEILSTRNLRNLTRTSSADERNLQEVAPDCFAYASFVSGRYDAVTLVGVSGERSSLTDDWPRRARWQNAVTNFQESGRASGFDRRRYALNTPSESLSFEVERERLSVQTDGGRVVLGVEDDEPLEGAALVEFSPPAKGMPGTLTWVVDTVRNLSFVGPEPIAWLEHRVFAVHDALQRGYYGVVGGPDTEAEVAAELGLTPLSEEETRRRAELAVTDPELGWPPATLTPVVRQPARGEGEWVAVVDDPFVRSYPNAPPAFYTTFLQVDPERPFTRVYVVVWDPRALQLRVMSGTREPESATGATASGMVPRDPETLQRVVAGFNGGFQSLHGEFGMMAEGRVYLPPKPWSATVAVYQDGRVAMGSWTGPPEGVRHYREEWAVRQIPGDMVEFRQNLTSVIEGDVINPWRRWYWGAAPQGDDEQAYIDRSGMCLTDEGFMAYFWGKSMGADELGEAMKATRCVRGLHLDMNQRHTAFEFYNVMPSDQLPALGRRLTADFEFEEDVPRARGFKARGRLLARSMTPMRFPRYIRQDPRDFFYLTLRPVLPGPDLEFSGETLEFVTSGLPHAGWPHAFAMSTVGEGESATYLVRIDPSRGVPGPLLPGPGAEPGQAPEALAYLTDSGSALAGPLRLFAEQQTVGRRFRVGASVSEGARVILAGPPMGAGHQAGLGVDADGFLVYAEGPRAQDVLTAAAPGSLIGLRAEQRLAFVVGELTAGPDAYERPVSVAEALVISANPAPASEVLFPDVQPRPYMYWGQIQDTRVRYFRGDEAPRFVAPDPAADAGP